MLVADIYNTHIILIQEDITIKEALEMFVHQHFNGVLVVDKNDKMVGILSLQDIAAAVVPPDFQQHTELANALYKPNFFREMCQEIMHKKVKEIMRKDFVTVTRDTSVMEIAADFLKNDLYIIPVCDETKPIGIVTRSEVKKALSKGMDIPLS